MVKGFAKRKHFEQVVNNQLAGILQSKDHLATEQSQKEQILNALRSFVIDEVSSEYIGEINRRLKSLSLASLEPLIDYELF